jgi:hypothetical protein
MLSVLVTAPDSLAPVPDIAALIRSTVTTKGITQHAGNIEIRSEGAGGGGK